ncbi:MAG: hypothetical protein ACI8ZM_000742 [Crocinitomix sp.]|jgi:hypothetical protein
MRSILKIRQPKNAAHIYWEHAMKTVFAFSGTFALLFFGPLFMAAGSRGGSQREAAVDRSLGILGWLFEHPEVQVSICLLVVVIYNITIIRKNSRKNYLVSFDIDGPRGVLGLTNLYYKTTEEIEILIENLEYEVQIKSVDKREKTSALKFFDTKSGNEIAVIKPRYILWNTQVKDVKKALWELDQLGVKKTKSKKNASSFIGFLFPN